MGMAAFAGTFADGTNKFLMAGARLRARLAYAMSGQKSSGQKLLETIYFENYKDLQQQFPGLFELDRLDVVVEVYEQELVYKTFTLLKSINDKQVANSALHTLGEMAMMDNSPDLYNRLIAILMQVNDDRRAEILYDSRLEFQLDENIEAVLIEYET